MVLQKRLDYGFNGYQVPPMAQVPKSAKGKRSVRRKVRRKTVDNPMRAFDLLAAIAGKLLQEGEGYLGSSKTIGTSNLCSLDIKQEQIKLEKPLKGEAFDLGSCTENKLQSNTISEREVRHAQKLLSKTSTSAPIIMKSDTFQKDACPEKPSLGIEKSNYGRYGTGVYRNDSDPHSLEDKMDLDVKSLAMVSSHNSVKVPLSGNNILRSRPFPKCREEKLVVNKDDDEKSSGCIQPSFRINKALKPARLGERRRKQLATKLWKVAPRMTKDRELSNTDLEMKSSFYTRKICYARQRTQRSSFKRRKFFQHCSVSSIRGCNKEGVLINSPEKPSVKLSIKSFKVPELFIEIPETSTVASLKRTVMEAVTAILGSGLRVGVLVHGQKVRDDSKTLIQAGISHGEKLDNLGFTLEPDSNQVPAPLASPEKLPLLPPCDDAKPLARFPFMVPPSDGVKCDICPESALTPILNSPESDHDSVHSHTDILSLDKVAADARALIAIPSISVETLPMTPIRKSKRSDLIQRRIRRPFSVTEVEALVQAVEKLGTGRWRDVKIRSFDNEKHRTYVDLKDKWKTLVHTARIAPQQRRGEPVPQHLLDRVLAAHGHWTQHQARLQVKSSAAESCLLL